MLRTSRDDSGAVAVIVAILIVVFVMFAALVVDVGYWYNVKRQLQASADAAALAGGWELAAGHDNDAIWGEVEAYANRNGVAPVDFVTVIPPSPDGMSDITDTYVKVTVETTGSVFFSGIFNREAPMIRAQAVAQIGYLAGARSPVPWALPIMRVSRMVAVANGVEYDLELDSDGNYTGMLPTGWSGDVSLVGYNDQTLDPDYPDGVPERFGLIGRRLMIPTTSLFADVRLDRNTVTSGWGESVGVEVYLKAPLAAGEGVVVNVGHRAVPLAVDAADPTRYAGSFSVPDITELWENTAVTFEIVRGGRSIELLPGSQLINVRRATFPVGDVRIEPTVFPEGSPGMTQVTVEINDYEYGREYPLRVAGGGAEVGNFMAVDFHQTHHTPYWLKTDPLEYDTDPWGGPDYYDFIAGVIPDSYQEYVLHVGDTIWTQPGAGSTPSIDRSLEGRFGTDTVSFAEWVAAGKPPSRRVLIVPITEKVQGPPSEGGPTASGGDPLRVVSFAAFYVERVTGGSDPVIIGRFVEYASSGWVVVDEPTDPNYVVRVAHLTADNLDF